MLAKLKFFAPQTDRANRHHPPFFAKSSPDSADGTQNTKNGLGFAPKTRTLAPPRRVISIPAPAVLCVRICASLQKGKSRPFCAPPRRSLVFFCGLRLAYAFRSISFFNSSLILSNFRLFSRHANKNSRYDGKEVVEPHPSIVGYGIPDILENSFLLSPAESNIF